MTNKAIIIERLFNASASKVWKALTDEVEMKIWYFDVPGFKAEKGYQFEFSSGPSPERKYVHLCEIKEVIPEKKISYSWVYEGYAGYTLVSFELIEQEDKATLKLTHEGIESFPEDNPDLAISNFEKGWDAIINTTLKEYLEIPE